MKITYFVNEYPKVSHSFIRREILALERQGIEVQRIALRGWDGPSPDETDRQERSRTRYVLRKGAASLIWADLEKDARLAGAFFSPRYAWRCGWPGIRIVRSPYHLIYVAEACSIIPWMRKFGSRHVHAHFGTNSAEVITLARVLGGPSFSFTVHGPDEFLRPMCLDEKVRRSAFVIAVSSFGRSQLYMRTAYPDWSKIQVVHCGLESEFFKTDATPPVTQPPRLVCVGRLCEAKGQLLLVEAAGRLAARGIPFELVFAGDGPMRAQLEKLIGQYDLSGQVRITGWISSDQVREELIAARTMVLPTFAEGLPVVIMEALALGPPCAHDLRRRHSGTG